MANFVTARPVAWVDGVSVNANDLRAARAALMTPGTTSLSPRGGVLPGPGDPGLISALGTPAMKVHVKAASYDVPSSSATGGSYTVVVDADADLDITASDASNPRTDLLIAEVVDNGDATTTYQVRILTGTAGPGAPRPTNTTPNAHWITIGSVDVRALAESSGYIRAQDVHAERLFTASRGGVVPVANQAERDALAKYPSLTVHRRDTGNLEVVDATLAWKTFTPANAMASGTLAFFGTYTGQPTRTIGSRQSVTTNGSGDGNINLPAGINGVLSGGAQGAGGTPFEITTFVYSSLTTASIMPVRIWNAGSPAVSTAVTLSWWALVW